MSLALIFGDNFSQRQIDQGKLIFENADNWRFRKSANMAQAEFYDDKNSTCASFEFEKHDLEDSIDPHCTCRVFANWGACPHLYALLLIFDQNARSGGVAGRPDWKYTLAKVQREAGQQSVPRPLSIIPGDILGGEENRLIYAVVTGNEEDLAAPQESLTLKILRQKMGKSGAWRKPQSFSILFNQIDQLPNQVDREVIRRLVGHSQPRSNRYSYYQNEEAYDSFSIGNGTDAKIIEQLAATNRLFYGKNAYSVDKDASPLKTDLKDPFEFQIDLVEGKGTQVSLQSKLTRGEEDLASDSVVIMLDDGTAIINDDRIVKVSNPASLAIVHTLNDSDPFKVPKKDRAAFVEFASQIQGFSALKLPETWKIEQVLGSPQGGVEISQIDNQKLLGVNFFFVYDDQQIASNSSLEAFFDSEQNRQVIRDFDGELALRNQVRETGVALQVSYGSYDFTIQPAGFARFSTSLSAFGWSVVWKGKPLRSASSVQISVESGEDWFDLTAEVNYAGESIPLPQVLKAIREKSSLIQLSDGSHGAIPQDLVDKYSKIAMLGEAREDVVRFRPSQAMILDAMLASQEHVSLDDKFKKFQKKLASFSGVQPQRPPKTFQGKLRKYQSEGLGWLEFLREFNLGGCLADDMGLGKTVQVLAQLEARRTRKTTPADKSKSNKRAEVDLIPGADSKKSKRNKTPQEPEWVAGVRKFKRKPSIVVVPKSLIFNWLDEAQKFAPKLRVFQYTGTGRAAQAKDAGEFDVLLTTYGTMRKDITTLSSIDFDYAILDESQAIKTSTALVSKACRLLRSDHRLAMTGTPVENHLGELWSLFEFLNPGILGNSKKFNSLTRVRVNDDSNQEAIASLAAGLKPYFLRRTKEQVLTDLPEKTEQLISCEMTPAQKKQYEEVREYYRVKLSKKVETDGIGKSKIYVLEALLRLRQIACDPRLVDPAAKPGAKLELLQTQLEEIIAGGHKALVFSQFTSLLDLVKQQFDSAGVQYEYLDGKTNNRSQRVKNFQENDDVSVFLISLKAGGSGLNLTAAQYVYLLDPWWNPAVEAQAIDRAHRMGQKNSVMAYRLTCKDTVEDKILKLQTSKRELADSVIDADDSLLRNLSADDLSILLG